MAKTFAVGTTRINPNTFMTEVWDGKTWNNGVSTVTGSTYTVAANGMNSTTVSPRPTISATERELIFDFLKDNMRVAEYVDDKNKVTTVQLEMRAGPGFVWEQVRRIKTTNAL